MLFFLIVEVDGTKVGLMVDLGNVLRGLENKTAAVDSDQWISLSDSPADRCPTDSSELGFAAP